jgi:hypothetical protein
MGAAASNVTARRAARVGALAAALVALDAAAPTPALAHGLVGRTDLPIPQWLFAWVAAVVLVVSFTALAALWSQPELQQPRERRLATVPGCLDAAAAALGIAILAAVIISGIAGAQVATANLAPTVVYVAFWVGVPLASALVGDVFRALSPWRAVARGLRAASAGRLFAARRTYPERVGRWPAAVGIVAFAWLELVYVGRDHPATLATSRG